VRLIGEEGHGDHLSLFSGKICQGSPYAGLVFEDAERFIRSEGGLDEAGRVFHLGHSPITT
jgi:hypothetical protein